MGEFDFTSVTDVAARLGRFWENQLLGTFLSRGSTLALDGLLCTLLLAAFLAVPRGRGRMPGLAVWRRALFPKRLLGSASGRTDIGFFLFGLFGYGLLFGWMLFSAGPVAAMIAHILTGMFGYARLPALPAPVDGAILTITLFLAYELAYWLDHYLSHRVPLLWQFHRVHHGAESLSLLTNFRVHPVDTLGYAHIIALVVGSTQGVACYLLGAKAAVWDVGGTNMLVMAASIALTHLQHSHLWVTFGPRWGRWLLSPAHHQIHHSADPRHFDRNFGSALAIWDRLFGTFHMPSARREPLRFGLGDTETSPHGLEAVVLRPMVNAFALRPRRHNVAPEPVPVVSGG